MFARDMKLYDVYALGALDAYGQPSAPAYSRTIKAAIYERSERAADSALFIEGEFIALTRAELTSENMIDGGGVWYKVLYTERRGTYNQSFLTIAGPK